MKKSKWRRPWLTRTVMTSYLLDGKNACLHKDKCIMQSNFFVVVWEVRMKYNFTRLIFLFIAKFARWIIHLVNFAMNRNIRRVKLFSLNVRYNSYKLEETWVTGWVKFVQTDWHEIATFGKWLIQFYSVFKESHDGWRLGTYQYLTLMIFLVIRKYISYLNNAVII